MPFVAGAGPTPGMWRVGMSALANVQRVLGPKLDQVVDAIRIRLVDQATTDQAGLVAVARRLVAIDPDRAGIGGLRLQLELARLDREIAAMRTDEGNHDGNH